MNAVDLLAPGGAGVNAVDLFASGRADLNVVSMCCTRGS